MRQFNEAAKAILNPLSEKTHPNDLYNMAKNIAYALEDGQTGKGIKGAEAAYKTADKLVDQLNKIKGKITLWN